MKYVFLDKFKQRQVNLKLEFNRKTPIFPISGLLLLIALTMMTFKYGTNLLPWTTFNNPVTYGNTTHPLSPGIWIEVSNNHIQLEGYPVLHLNSNSYQEMDTYLSTHLKRAFKQSLFETSLSLSFKNSLSKIIIKSHPDTNYGLVKQITYLASAIGYSNYELNVIKQ